jgi:hypothetical protein
MSSNCSSSSSSSSSNPASLVTRAFASGNEINEIHKQFEMPFFDALPDDQPQGRASVRRVCAEFVRSGAAERLLEAVPVCMELILDTASVTSEEAGNDAGVLALSADVEHAVRKAKRAVIKAFDCLWNASARPDPKCPMIEAGVVAFVVKLHADLHRVADEAFVTAVQEASMGIVPNLTQARFAHGHRNVHLAALITDSGCVSYLLGFLDDAEARFDRGYRATSRQELRLWFLSINALANLSLEPTHGESLARHWPRFDKFWLISASVLHAADIFHYWNSFGSFASLLSSPHPLVARWSLRCLCEFARDSAAVPRVFRALGVVSSLDSVRHWCTVPETALFADSLVQLLGVAHEETQPDLLPPPPDVGAPALDRSALAAFSDIDLIVVDDAGREADRIAAHRVVLAGRSVFFAALFASGMRDANDRCVRIVDVDPVAFGAAIEFLYSGALPQRISAQLAVDLVATFVRFGIGSDGVALRKLEYLLCLQIDSRETAVALLDLCSMHDGALPRLQAQVRAYLARAEISSGNRAKGTLPAPTTTTSAQE